MQTKSKPHFKPQVKVLGMAAPARVLAKWFCKLDTGGCLDGQTARRFYAITSYVRFANSYFEYNESNEGKPR